MSYKLLKPYTLKDRMNFIVEYNHKQGLRIEETELALFALKDNEIIVNGEAVINPNYQSEQAKIREENFKNEFFRVEDFGYYRRKPKGYNSAVESLNTAFNMVSVLGVLPANTLTFYREPDFYNESQCTEDWLVANSFKNNLMSAEEFGNFYAKVLTAWNNEEHK